MIIYTLINHHTLNYSIDNNLTQHKPGAGDANHRGGAASADRGILTDETKASTRVRTEENTILALQKNVGYLLKQILCTTPYYSVVRGKVCELRVGAEFANSDN